MQTDAEKLAEYDPNAANIDEPNLLEFLNRITPKGKHCKSLLVLRSSRGHPMNNFYK